MTPVLHHGHETPSFQRTVSGLSDLRRKSSPFWRHGLGSEFRIGSVADNSLELDFVSFGPQAAIH
jgi:hypothetical protein